jgi:hypothetical protein
MNRPAWATASAASRRNGQNQWTRRPLPPYSSSPRVDVVLARALRAPPRTAGTTATTRCCFAVRAELSAHPDETVELDEVQASRARVAALPLRLAGASVPLAWPAHSEFVLSERELRDIGDARLPRGAVVTRAGVAAWPLLRFDFAVVRGTSTKTTPFAHERACVSPAARLQ